MARGKKPRSAARGARTRMLSHKNKIKKYKKLIEENLGKDRLPELHVWKRKIEHSENALAGRKT